MEHRESALSQAEEFSISENVTRLATAVWMDPQVGRRFAEEPEVVLKEFGIDLPEPLDLVPLGLGRPLGKPTPDFTPFEIRLSRCRTVVVRDPDTGMLKTETVCFGIDIIPKFLPGGPRGR